ncbi:MAG: TatD family hydrolase, partial [Promethearchaeota archaeon]
MSSKIKVPEPEENINFIDVHCHIPFPRQNNDLLPSDISQYNDYFKLGGLYLISCSIDMATLTLVLQFLKDKENMGFTCGWAPQTVTYTPKSQYEKEWDEWVKYIESNTGNYLAIGEIGLDFHHAKTLEKRIKQVDEFRKILELTEDFDKPYVLHVRNAATHERDNQHPNHEFNVIDGANREILKILKEFNINPAKVMWHCFSGPEEYGSSLPSQGFLLSVPSSAYGFNRWQKVTKESPLEHLVTE